jgi:hypothetical protein
MLKLIKDRNDPNQLLKYGKARNGILCKTVG